MNKNSTWKHLGIAGSGDQVKSVQSFCNPKSIQLLHSGVVEGGAGVLPPQESPQPQPLLLHLCF